MGGGGGLDFLMVAGGIPEGCFCLGKDKKRKERGRCIDFFFFFHLALIF